MRDFWFAALYSFLEKEDIEQLQKKKKKKKKEKKSSFNYFDLPGYFDEFLYGNSSKCAEA